ADDGLAALRRVDLARATLPEQQPRIAWASVGLALVIALLPAVLPQGSDAADAEGEPIRTATAGRAGDEASARAAEQDEPEPRPDDATRRAARDPRETPARRSDEPADEQDD